MTYALRSGTGSERPDVAVTAERRGQETSPRSRAQISGSSRRGLRGFEPNYFPFVELRMPICGRYSLDAPGEAEEEWIVDRRAQKGEFEFLQQGSCPRRRSRCSTAPIAPDCRNPGPGADQGNLPTPRADPAAPSPGTPLGLCPALVPALEERQSYSMFCSRLPAEPRPAGEKPAAEPRSPRLDRRRERRTAPNLFRNPVQHRFGRRPGAASATPARPSPRRARSRFGRPPGIRSPPGLLSRLQQARCHLRHGDRSRRARRGQELLFDRRGAGTAPFGHACTVIQGEADDPEGEDRWWPFLLRFPLPARDEALPGRAKRGQWFDRSISTQVGRCGARRAHRRSEPELFARLCGDQYAELREANLKLARLRAAEELVKRGAGRRLDRLAPATALLLSQPLQAVVLESDGGPAIEEALRSRGVPTSYVARTLRRQAAKRPIRDPAATAATKRGKTIPTPFIPGDVSVLAAAAPGRATPRRGSSISLRRADADGLQEIGLGADGGRMPR